MRYPGGLSRRGALGLILLGFMIAAIRQPTLLATWRIDLWRPALLSLGSPTAGAALHGALVQAPLTLLNSVFAVSLLAGKLFPKRAERTAPTNVAISVGLINLIACPFGAMPMCHGSGGLAAQVAFGARGGLSMGLVDLVGRRTKTKDL